MGSAAVIGTPPSVNTASTPKKKKTKPGLKTRKVKTPESVQTSTTAKTPPKGIGKRQARADQSQENKVKNYQNRGRKKMTRKESAEDAAKDKSYSRRPFGHSIAKARKKAGKT